MLIAEGLKQGDIAQAGDNVGFVIGPEGGFVKSELDALRQLPFSTALGLGPRILRAETAALAALACWQALCGDWSRDRSTAYGGSLPDIISN